MSEHSKIPFPAGDGEGGKSLFERAEKSFGLGGYSPAPVPRELAPPVNRRVVKRAAPAPEPEVLKPEPATQAVPEPAPPAAAPHPAPAPEAVARPPEPGPVAPPRVRTVFAGDRHRIDRDLMTRKGLIRPDGPVTALLEEFRIVKRQLLASARASATDDASARRILVCSPLPGEGKTFCAVNLALAMASERDCEVLLIDADVAKPSILSLLGLPKRPGLMDMLAGFSIRPEDGVIATDVDGLFVLGTGDQTNVDSEYLASSRAADLLDRLTDGAPERVLIFDSPPALAASPAADLAKHVGQALVIARADRTGQSALEDALSLLSSCPDIKLLLNAANFSPSGRRFGAYYGYGG